VEIPTVESTQELAVQKARAGEGPGTLIVAERQSRGRGRLTHEWESPPGGLYLSLLLPEPKFGRSLVPMALGVAVADALTTFGVHAEVKWPNDLLVPSANGPARKVAGILVDRVAPRDGGPILVAGVGVNVRADPAAYPVALRPRVVQVTELAGHPVSVREVESRVVPNLMSAVDELSTREGWRKTAQHCRAALFGRGRRARVDGRIAGTIGELGDDGSLWLAGDEGPIQVVSGDLVVEEA